MSDTSKSVRKVFSKAINLGLLAMLGGGTAAAAPVASHSISKRASRNAVVYVAEDAATHVKAERSESVVKTKRQAFSSFGKSQKKMHVIKHEPSKAAINFLQDNDLLKTDKTVAANISGEILGRKAFAHEAPAAHCHASFGTYYTSTNATLNASICVNSYGGTWVPASTKPFVKNPAVVNKTTTSFQINFTATKASTVYAVVLSNSAVAPSSAQVIAGTDGSGNSAVATANQAVTTTGSFSFSSLTVGANYIVYIAARDGTSQVTPTPLQVNPAFETGLISNVGNWKFPKVRTNSAGDFFLGQADSGNIKFRKWNGSGFSDYAQITPASVSGANGVSWGNEQRVDYEVDSLGRIYVVFSVYETQWAVSGDPYFGYYNGSTWTFNKITETGAGVDNVDVFLDANGKVHTAFISQNLGPNTLYYATNASGSWVTKTIVTSSASGMDEIQDLYVVADSTGKASVIYRREDEQNNGQDDYYLATSTNNFASPTLILNGKVDLKQYRLAGVAVDANDKLHYAYAELSSKTSFYATNASGSWVTTPITKGGHSDITVEDYERVGTTDYFANYSNLTFFMTSFDGTSWVDGFDFTLNGFINDRFAINVPANRIMYVSENSNGWTISYHTGVIAGYITPAAPNNAPTDIALTNSSINQSAGTNGVIGALSSTDADSGNTHTYSLVSGVGDTNNTSFNISGSSLRLTNPNSLAGGTYSVRVRTTDNAGGTFEKAFTITVVDNLAPSVSSIVLSGSPTSAATSVTFTVTFGESASNISTDDFVLTAIGTAAGTIASVSASSGTSVTVTVNTITGSGTLRLDLKASTNITDTTGNGNGTNGFVAAFTGGSTHTVAVPTVPSAPTSPVATAGNGQVSVVFTAPGNTGGASITSYTVTASPGGATGTGSSSPIVVTGLTNGTAYTFTVTATNSVGTSSASNATNSVTPQATQTITFTNPGAQNYGTTPTFSATTTSSLAVTFTSATTGVCTITSGGVITFVTAGTCTINADQAGNAAYLAATRVSRSFTVNAVVPAAPTIGTATAGDTQATITFTTPTSNGGASITGYTVTSNPGGITGTGSGSPITVTGLTNGVAYTFTVTATNSTGTGSASAATNSITPAATQTITFTNPGAQNFGTTPTLSATSDSGLTPTFTSSTTGVCTITTLGVLTFVSTGTCTVGASQAGNSSYLAATPVSRSFTVNAVAPGAPTIGTVTAGDTQAIVTFTPPASNGGTTITVYTVTANPGGITATGTGSPITITGLTNGVNYTFTVTATTTAGTGSASSASGSVSPAANQSITFADPGTQNFGAIPSLSASASSGLPVSFASSTPGVCSVNGSGVVALVTIGTCTITVSQAGNASYLPASSVSHSFSVAAVVPAAPTIGTATAGNGQASVTFSAPGFSGGVAITGYTVTASPGGATASGTASPIVVTGLTNGTAYTFVVTATNSVGTGTASAASNSITPIATQTITFVDPGTQSLGTAPTFTATSSSGLTVTFTSTTTSVCTITSGGVVTFLTSGTCTIEASQAGNSAYQAAPSISRSFSVVPVVPGAPSIGVVTANNGQATVAFTAPSATGSSAITSYTVTANPGGITATGSGSPIVVTGLTDGVAYTFTVTATSSAGTGASSGGSSPVTPKTSQTITFADPGAQNLGTTPTFSATTTSGLPVSFSSSTVSVCIVSSGGVVTLLSSGTCTIEASQAGNGTYQAATGVVRSFSVVPVVPGAPTIGLVTANDGQAVVAFTAPSTTGGAAITGYVVTSNPGSITATGSSSPITVTGLTDGVTYTFTVTAINSAGTGTASAPSGAVTPKTSQTISFMAPGPQAIGSPASLSATASSGLAVSFTSSTPSVCIVSLGGLTFISTGTCTINAEQMGNGIYAAAPTITHSFSVGNAANSLPVITQGSVVNVTMSEDGAPTAFALQLNATDSNEGDSLTWSISIQPTHGSASVASNGGVSYIPNENYNGSDSFTVSVSDGKDSASIQVNVTVTAVNDPPVISGVPPTTVNQDVAYSFVPVVTDPDGDSTFTFSIVNKPAWATFNPATGALTGTPTAANIGSVSNIVISVSDGTTIVSLPAFGIQVSSTADPLAPVLTVPANLQIDATALYTPITLRQLLKLSNNSTQAELDTGLDKLATDTSGKSCCTTIAAGVTATQPLLLPPGRHEVKWTATNQAGLKTTGVQTVDVRPLVSLSKSQIALRGTSTEFRIILNGPAPTYPVTVSYVLDEATTATTAEHTLTSGTATLANNGQLEVAVPVTLKPVSGLSDSQIVVRLTGDINIGATNRHTISIREGNVPPTVTLSLTQNSFPTTTITPNGGPVTVTANVKDLNVNDTHAFDWSATSGLPDTDGNPTNAVRVFDPTGLTGSHQIQVSVTDSGGAVVQAQLYFHVLPSLPVLSATEDTDGDGIVDELEGTGDADGNGIPDYLDNMRSSNILPQKIVTTDKYLIECDPGVRCGLGLLAMASSTGGVQILDSEVATLGNLKVDSTFTPVGGIFDFAVADLPTAGQAVNIVIPQTAAIPANAVYRKFQNGQWVNFVQNADNVLRSTLGNPGYCPPPGSADWQPGLIAGNYCVQLTITDGGPNDGDGIVNSAVVDPGAVSVAVPVVPPVEPPVVTPPTEIKTKGSGGSVDFTLLLIMGIMGGSLLMCSRSSVHRRTKLFALGALLLVAIDSQALTLSDQGYLRLDAYKVNGSQSEYEFNSALANEGYGFTLTKYEVNRTGSQISVGYKWNDAVYTELGYLDLGNVRVNLLLDADEDQAVFGKSFARHYPVSADGVTLVQGVKLSFNRYWSVSPEVGIFAWKEEVDVNGATFKVGDKHNADLLVGLRLDYQITKSFGLGLSTRSILFNENAVNLWGISTRWDF